ncbi:DegV family protein [Gemella sp. zg-1178]|uniref:DegV family protein n=1 Tax=Gemella sp. zg-1178 TaxID=2840372 RepID=UPI00207B1C50|nr:DegV family protein [Gemella sp. zg-1178]
MFMRNYLKEGYDIISIHLSDAISGTFNTATLAASEFSNVTTINSKTTSRGMVYLIKECFEQISQGKTLKEIIEILNNKTSKILTYVTIDNLNNLVKGGRLKKTSGLIGNLLNIKILTKLEGKELVAVDKVRCKKKLINALIEKLIADSENKIKNIHLAHALSDEYLALIKEAVLNRLNYNIDDKNIVVTSPIISTHTGEGAVGILVELE